MRVVREPDVAVPVVVYYSMQPGLCIVANMCLGDLTQVSAHCMLSTHICIFFFLCGSQLTAAV